MTVDMNKVAGGLSRRKLFFDGGAGHTAPEGASVERVDLERAVEAVQAIHTLTPEELQSLCDWYKLYPTGERIAMVRHAQMELGNGTLIGPSVSDARTNRGVVLRAGPRAMVELRLARDPTKKVTVDLHPGDHLEFGIYAVGEIPVAMRECPIPGIDVLIVSVRDITQIVYARELAAHEAQEDDHA